MEITKNKHSPAQLNLLLGSFSIHEKEFSFLPLTAGLINDTYLVRLRQKPTYILQRINNGVFSDVAGIMKNVTKALSVLESREYKKISFVPGTNGKPFVKIDGAYWRLMTFIPDSTTYNTTGDTRVAFEAGSIIGEFHTLLQNQHVCDYEDTIPRFHDLGLREEQFKRALSAARTSTRTAATSEITGAHAILEQLGNMELGGLKIRICHNDTKLNNILFSKESNKALCLIDLDTVMKGYFFHDFGDAVRTIVNTAPEDEKALENISFNKSLFSAFVEGLGSKPSFLTGQELESLPMGAVFMPFIHGLRALTDYLENNRYYKVSYEQHNLDRCKSLFHFSQKALDNIPFMEGIIQEHLV